MKGFAAFLLLMTPVATALAAVSAAEEFGARRFPNAPLLAVDTQPEFCKQVLAAATSQFSSEDSELDLAAASMPGDAEVLVTEALDGQGTEESTWAPLKRVDVDLDGNGHKQVLIFRTEPTSGADAHSAYVFSSVAAFEARKAEVIAAWHPARTGPSSSDAELGASQFYPSVIKDGREEVATGAVSVEPSLFQSGGRYFLIEGKARLEKLKTGPVSVFRLYADGHVERLCQASFGRTEEMSWAFQRLPAVLSFLTILRQIGAGDINSRLSTHEEEAQAAEIRAASRPWATSSATAATYAGENVYYRYDERTRAFLEQWSLENLWNRREYQTLLELTGAAEASYAGYLQTAFGVAPDTARLDAVKVIQALMGSRLLVPNEYSTSENFLYFPSTPLRWAVTRRDRAAFETALAHPEATAGSSPGVPPKKDSEVLGEVLADAVEWPYALDKLLAAHADPNHRNFFGKTPLMAAAHFDRVDAVRKLLAAGAEVNAATTEVSESWREGPKRTHRTALMYAAENASPAVMKALLEARADAAAVDSMGGSIADYLARSPRYTDAERAKGVAGLAKDAEQFAGPSFRCTDARTPAERSICSSETLRIFDAQIARTFEALHAKLGGSFVQEQKAWLRTRNQSCQAAQDVDCLAEVMRTRVRYLHDRLAEPSAHSEK